MPQPSVAGFASIRGHQRACDFLHAMVRHERLPHALLFAGSDGIGKRAVAVAFAAWILCEHSGDDACGRCASCRQIAARSHPDFQLVEVASGKKEIGVERARDVKRFVQLQPVSGRLKVAVIDDAHMLTVAAQNALLKTLEEPPQRSVLILVANNPDALLPTVRSRCQRLHFAPLAVDVVVDILTGVHGIDPVVAEEAATLAEGSPGRALGISMRDVGESREHLLQSLAGLREARYVELMQLAGELSQPEADTAVKLEMLLAHHRDAAVRQLSAGEATVRRDLRAVLERADAIHEAAGWLRRGSPNRPLLLEALLLRLART